MRETLTQSFLWKRQNIQEWFCGGSPQNITYLFQENARRRKPPGYHVWVYRSKFCHSFLTCFSFCILSMVLTGAILGLVYYTAFREPVRYRGYCAIPIELPRVRTLDSHLLLVLHPVHGPDGRHPRPSLLHGLLRAGALPLLLRHTQGSAAQGKWYSWLYWSCQKREGGMFLCFRTICSLGGGMWL